MDEEISLSVEETNALRLKLGLKPLKLDSKEVPINKTPTIVQKPEVKEAEITTEDWLTKMSKMSATPTLNGNFLPSRHIDYKIGHDFEDIGHGQHIFTLKDTNDELAVLENRNIKETTKALEASILAAADMTADQPGLYESEIDNKGFLLSDPKPKKRKLDEYLGPKESLEVTPTIPAAQGKVKAFKKFKKSKRNLREAEEERTNLEPIKTLKRPDIEDIIGSSRPTPQITNRMNVAPDTTEIPEEDIGDLLVDISKTEQDRHIDKMVIDNIEESEEILEEGELGENPQIRPKLHVSFKDTPNSNYVDLPSFSVAPFLPKIAAFVDLHDISLKIKNIDAEIEKMKEARKKTKNNGDLRKMDDRLKRLDQQRFELVDQKMANYKPKVNLEYKQGGKTLTQKEAYKVLGGKPKKHSK